MPKTLGLPPLEWDGFDAPTYTQVPDALFDLLLPYLSDAELRVLLYIIRRTFGFKKSTDDISLKQLTDGIVKRDGERMDYGAGLGKSAAAVALRTLEEKGIISRQRNDSPERGHEATTYTLRMRGTPLSTKRTSLIHETDKGSPASGQALVQQVDIQETVVQGTESKSESGAGVSADSESSAEIAADDDTSGQAPPYSPWIADVIVDYSRELGDLANSSANVERALRIWQQSGLREDAFVEVLRGAKSEVRKAQGSRAVGANKMQAFYRAVTALAAAGGKRIDG